MIRLFTSAVCAAMAAGILAGCSGSSLGSSNSSLPSLETVSRLAHGPMPTSGAPPLAYGERRPRKNTQGYQLLYSFGGSHGAYPGSGALINVAGTLYGTTNGGGNYACTDGCGTVFKITTSGTESVIYSFAGGSDGAHPYAGLTNVAGTLYGTTQFGGASSDGTVFKVTTSGTESVIYSFTRYPKDGSNPQADLTDVAGRLYGTTYQGGTSNDGTVFAIKPSGKEETVLHSFGGSGDGSLPVAGMTNVGGTLYGTTSEGGTSGYGTVFKITTSGTETVLHSFVPFSGDGIFPYAGLTNASGTLFGTTSGGGTSNDGTVFKITTSGAESVLYSFSGGSSDGAAPFARLTDVRGTFYGTTYYGGTNCPYDGGCGTIFAIKGKKETVLHSFGGSGDGSLPVAGMTNVGGTLYGTTYRGGTSNVGTVFLFSP